MTPRIGIVPPPTARGPEKTIYVWDLPAAHTEPGTVVVLYPVLRSTFCYEAGLIRSTNSTTNVTLSVVIVG